MKTRNYLPAAWFVAVVLVAVLSAVALVVNNKPDEAPKVEHGSFSGRFQPVPPKASQQVQAVADVGSIRELRPVPLETR